MKMSFTINSMFGTTIEVEGGKSIEKGMFNAFGFERELNTK